MQKLIPKSHVHNQNRHHLLLIKKGCIGTKPNSKVAVCQMDTPTPHVFYMHIPYCQARGERQDNSFYSRSALPERTDCVDYSHIDLQG